MGGGENKALHMEEAQYLKFKNLRIFWKVSIGIPAMQFN